MMESEVGMQDQDTTICVSIHLSLYLCVCVSVEIKMACRVRGLDQASSLGLLIGRRLRGKWEFVYRKASLFVSPRHLVCHTSLGAAPSVLCGSDRAVPRSLFTRELFTVGLGAKYPIDVQ